MIAHNQYVASCCVLFSQVSYRNNLIIFLSIAHDKMDKSNTSIPRTRKEEKDISNVVNLTIPLIGMLAHGQKARGFGHFSLSFLEMRLNFTFT